MPVVWFYFDFACAHAYLALHQLPNVLQGLSWQVRYCPIVQQNKCNISDITKAQKLTQQKQLVLHPPAMYPFDARAWSLMALAASPHGRPSRLVCSTLFNTIWQHGHNPNNADIQQRAWHEVTELLPHTSDRNNLHAQQQLEDNHAMAMQYRIAYTPSFVLHTHAQPHVFCGLEALPKLQIAVQNHQIKSL